MRKNTRIFILIILILIALGITTSIAASNGYLNDPTVDFGAPQLVVKGDTTGQEMVDALLGKGEYEGNPKTLTGISMEVKEANDSIYCGYYRCHLYKTAVYEFAGKTTDFPGTDSNSNEKIDKEELEENGYAKAYILAAPGYVKNDGNTKEIVTKADERQYAWNYILGQLGNKSANDLYLMAMEYQEYKEKEEVPTTVNKDNANTIISGGDAVYGPITVTYSYKKATSGTKSDEWGGFNYAFFDEKDTNISNKVTLCTLENGIYKPITPTDISDGYYQVKDVTYNNKDLYVVTNDKTVSTVKLKIQENKVEYVAEIYALKGEYDRSNPGYVRCSSCKNRINNAITSKEDAMVSLGNDANGNPIYPILSYNGKYYVYTGTTTDTKYASGEPSYINNVYKIGDEKIPRIGSVTYKYTDTYKCSYCGTYHVGGLYHVSDRHSCSWTNADGSKESHSGAICNICHDKLCQKDTGSQKHESGKCLYSSERTAAAHVEEKHFSPYRKFTRTVYEFEEFTGCGEIINEKTSKCGTYLDKAYDPSQALDIVTTTTTQKSNNITVIPDMKFATSIEVTKVWEDNNNAANNRPSSITVKLLTNGKDSGKTLTLNSANSWKGVFENLPIIDANGKDITYTVQESGIPVAYTTSGPTGSGKNGYTITNTLQTVNVPVTKVWDDANNQDGLRPNSINITLYADGVEKETKTINSNGTNKWTYTFTGLPKYVNGKLVTYTVGEKTAPTGYTKTQSGNTITNKHIPEVIDIPATKVWDDANDQDGLRPTSITVILKADGTTKQTVTLNESNNWKYTFKDLPKYKNQGTQIVYTIDEQTIPTGYTKTINGYTITNKHIPEVIDIPVTKVWNDNNNQDGLRPSSITITLYKDGKATNNTITLNASNNWAGIFEDLPKYQNHGTLINYTAKESGASAIAYTKSTAGNQTKGYTFTNTLKTLDIPVTKVWNDINNRDGLRPDSITVTLYENGTATNKTLTLNESNSWKGTFSKLPEYKNEKKVVYTVQETGVPTGAAQYMSEVTGNQEAGYTITNIHYDGYIEISGKVWEDKPDGKGNDINGTSGDDVDGLPEGVKIVLKDSKGNPIKSTYTDEKGELARTDYAIPKEDDGTYTIRVNYDNSNNVYKLYEDAKTIEEKVYGTDSNGDGVYENYAYVEFEYNGIKYTTVATATSGANTSKAKENQTTRTSLDKKYSKVTPETVYPENENITASTQSIIKSFATYTHKNTIESTEFIKYCNGNGKYEQTNLEKANGSITTGTHTCPNCIGTGHELKTYDVEVQRIENVNLGLFKREQPDVAIKAELSKVQVIMNNQEYTYLYNKKSQDIEDKAKESYNQAYNEAIANGMTEEQAKQYAKQIELKVKFQTKDTYVYRRPINPADIAYLKSSIDNRNKIEIYVTYEIKVVNTSTTLPVIVHNIINTYDSEYTISSIVDADGQNISYSNSTYYEKIKESKEVEEILLKDVNITADPGIESGAITLTYKVNESGIESLLEGSAKLNNAVEIESYSTTYGEKTLYAEQQTGGRTGNKYGGYDYNSHPGNADIEYKSGDEIEKAFKDAGKEFNQEKIDRLYSYQEVQPKGLEDDTDFAPSFSLEEDKNASKTLSGTIWEDADANTTDAERLGNGKYDQGEALAQNVKVELYEMLRNNENKITVVKPATIYDKDGNAKTAIAYTDRDGKYKIEGVVTGEYFMKFTYGDKIHRDGEEIITTIGDVKVNARNYKSTIITDPAIVDRKEKTTLRDLFNKDYSDFSDDEEKWHITHTDGYSVAVDNISDRFNIQDLTYETFDDSYNMTAYTKPFKTQVEFKSNGESNSDVNGKIDVSNVLDRLDFGIAERPREDLYVEKTINSFRITLANGQELASGNPADPNANMNYTKAIGFNQNISSGQEARNALAKRLIVEMDAELIQGARLQVEYAVKVTNNNEIDYDYGEYDNYKSLFEDSTKREYDKYILKEKDFKTKIQYYYYGDKNGLTDDDILKTTIEFVDYIDYELGYALEASDWNVVNKDDLKDLISNDTYNVLKDNKYIALQSTAGAAVTLARGESVGSNMSASKIISNKDENVFDNNAEIIKIDAKTARTIQEINGEVTVKSYKPGNYVPSSSNEKTEQDDDKVAVIITPPTGITTYILPYILIGTVGLMVIGIGIIFIKKKILIK